MTASLIEHFATLEDPRIERSKSYALIEIFVLAVFVVVGGAEQFGKEKLDWLRQYDQILEKTYA